MFTLKKTALAACAALSLLPLAAHAQTQAYTFTSAPTKNDFPDTLGFSFTVSGGDITVTDLGFLNTVDGTSHTVGIFDSNGNAVGSTASVTVSGNYTGGAPTFTFVSVTPFTLTSGQTYVIGGTNPGNLYAVNTVGYSQDSHISYQHAQYNASGPGLQYPSSVYDGNSIGNFGPNFEFTAAPEPSQFAGLGLGVLGLAGLGWKARKRA